ncbi:hypothetical protein [Massilia sp. TWR1-2-2]|uniref:hypothetical protein n=1 Tax=Massilia sp. TWR1-2-2 TaxID=2804584 RepID=UPI003CEA71A1
MRHLSLIFLLACAACSSATSSVSPPPPAATASAPGQQGAVAELRARIDAQLGDAACDGPQQCHSMPVGARPCGGPDGFIAWSSKRTDEKQLGALVARHAAARREENMRNDMNSTCQIETNPGATCQAGRCMLRPRGLGAQPADAS